MRQCKALAVVFAPAFAISGASSTQDFMAEPGAFLVHTRVGIVDPFAPTSEHGSPPSVLQSELQPLGYARSASIGSKAATPIWPSSRHPPLRAVCGRKPWCRARRLGRFKPPRARSFYVVRPRAARPRHAGLVDLTPFR